MKVILREDVEGIAVPEKTVEVKSGYGRNYLIPRNLAIVATRANLKAIDVIRKQKDVRDRKARRQAEIVKERIEKLELSVEVLVGEDEKLFGSVTNADIAKLLEAEGVTIDKRAIQLDTPIKVLGVYTTPCRIEKDVIANIKLWVVKKS